MTLFTPEAARSAVRLKIREPISSAPFLFWCDEREAQITRQHTVEHGIHVPTAEYGPNERLLHEIGWGDLSGARRLHRWRYQNTTGVVERAVVENALHCAGVDFTTIYPNVETPQLTVRIGQAHAMPDSALLAAHLIYTRERLIAADIAALIWQRYGYPNPASAERSLCRGWTALGLPKRRCVKLTREGKICTWPPGSRTDLCHKHQRSAP